MSGPSSLSSPTASVFTTYELFTDETAFRLITETTDQIISPLTEKWGKSLPEGNGKRIKANVFPCETVKCYTT